MNATNANTLMNQAPTAVETWGPLADQPHLGCMDIFYSVVSPALATNYPFMADFHDRLDKHDPIPAPLMAQYLDQLSALGQVQPSFVWAAANIALRQAVSRGHFELVLALLSIARLQLCRSVTHSMALYFAHLNAMQGSNNGSEILGLLISDPRFGGDALWSFLDIIWDQKNAKDAVHVLLVTPVFPSKMLWEHALDLATSTALEPHLVALTERTLPAAFHIDTIMDTGDWQFVRARNLARDRLTHPWPVPTRLVSSPTCPELFTGMPWDIQFRLHNLLDWPTVRSLQLTCRALRHFPIHRFAQPRVQHALRYLSKPSSSHYARVPLQHLIDSAPHHLGPSTLDYRALVEAVRYLDVDLALKFLRPLPQDATAGYDLMRASDPAAIGYVVSWALFVLLKKLKGRNSDEKELAKTGILLEALLLHPLLSDDAWSLTLYFFDACRSALQVVAAPSAASLAPSPPQFLIHLIRTGELLDPIPPTILADLQGATASLAMSTITCLGILLARLACTPATFKTLVGALPLPPHLQPQRTE